MNYDRLKLSWNLISFVSFMSQKICSQDYQHCKLRHAICWPSNWPCCAKLLYFVNIYYVCHHTLLCRQIYFTSNTLFLVFCLHVVKMRWVVFTQLCPTSTYNAPLLFNLELPIMIGFLLNLQNIWSLMIHTSSCFVMICYMSISAMFSRGPFYWYGLSTRIINHMHG